MPKRKPKRRDRKRYGLPNLPDRRNVARGTKWLEGMIEASEGKRTTEDVLQEMQPLPLMDRRVNEND